MGESWRGRVDGLLYFGCGGQGGEGGEGAGSRSRREKARGWAWLDRDEGGRCLVGRCRCSAGDGASDDVADESTAVQRLYCPDLHLRGRPRPPRQSRASPPRDSSRLSGTGVPAPFPAHRPASPGPRHVHPEYSRCCLSRCSSPYVLSYSFTLFSVSSSFHMHSSSGVPVSIYPDLLHYDYAKVSPGIRSTLDPTRECLNAGPQARVLRDGTT